MNRDGHGGRPRPPSLALEVYDSLPSTSDELIARAGRGAPEAALLARRQTAGRGSRGRQWHDGAGNLMLSVLLRPAHAAGDIGQWSICAGLAVVEALSAYVDTPGRLQLKWPNDILLDGAKLAGILIDAQTAPGGGIAWLVIGIGANLARAPKLPDRETAHLSAAPLPQSVAAAILRQIELWRHRLESEGFLPVRDAWLRRAHPCGTPLAVTLPAGSCCGRFAGLNANGALLLEVGGTVAAITVAEIALVGER